MLTTSEILDYLKQNKQLFKKDYHILKLGLFGSFARNQQTETSDIDIIIELEPNTDNIFELKLKFRQKLEQRFKRNIDICTEKYIKPIIKPLIIQEAIYV